MSSKPALLYLSPVIPALTGNGLAMRAGIVLEALAARYDVWLLVVRLYGGMDVVVPPRLEALCKQTKVILPRPKERASLLQRLWGGGTIEHAYSDLTFDVIHVFRMATLPWAEPYRSARSRLHLDLDDLEPKTHRRLAALYRLHNDLERAANEEQHAASAEATWQALAGIDRVYVCSAEDRAELSPRFTTEICVLPNAVRLPARMASKAANGEYRFLFVGSLGYLPNEDAGLYLCRDIVPRLRERLPEGFQVDIAGAGASGSLQRAAETAGVQLLGFVRDIAECYRNASAVMVPIRAGGGTRIKILEAFSYGRPVVSTSVGAEGIRASDGQQLLLADTPDAFAAACERIARDSDLARALADRALALVDREYSLDALIEIVKQQGRFDPS